MYELYLKTKNAVNLINAEPNDNVQSFIVPPQSQEPGPIILPKDNKILKLTKIARTILFSVSAGVICCALAVNWFEPGDNNTASVQYNHMTSTFFLLTGIMNLVMLIYLIQII